MEERAERNAVLHAEVMRERDALLKPHNSDGTITCPECHKSMGGDGLVEALRECVKERDAAVSNLTAFIEADTNRTILMMRTGLAIEARDKALAAQKEAEMYRKGAEYNEGLMRADLEAVEKERDLLHDKWNQMEAYGFGSPSQVFARLEAAEKAQKEAEERIDNANRALGNAVSLEEAVRQTLLETHEMEEELKEAEERLKEAHVMDCSCGVVSLRGHPVDPDCAALRTRTETKA
jgi:hypothetical protein